VIEPVRFQATADSRLSIDMLNAFYRDGYLILEDFVHRDACDLLNQRVDQLIADFDPESVKPIFAEPDRAAANERYLRESSDKIRLFFDDKAFDANGVLAKDKRKAPTRIGHAIHDLDSLFDDFSRDPSLATVAREIGMAQPVMVSSAIEIRRPGQPRDADVHQDGAWIYTEPASTVGFWFALDSFSRDSACLVALTGEHRHGFRDRTRLVDNTIRTTPVSPQNWNYGTASPLDVPKGTLILIGAKTPYFVSANNDDLPKRSYMFHLVDRTTRWAGDNWLRRPPELPMHGFE